MVSARLSTASRPLRFVVFGSSIVSDWENPVATSSRALLDALARAGHEVTYLEQRSHPALLTLLRRHGSHAVRAFTERYAAIRYGTYDLPRGWERAVWFGREVATADVVVALPGTPPSLLPEIAALPGPHPVTLVDAELEAAGTFRLRRRDNELAAGELAWGPAVTVIPGMARAGNELLIVAYDSAADALAAVHACAGLPFEHVVCGSAELPGWRFVPEVELPTLYARHAGAIVTGAGGSAWADARRLLPLASGCRLVDPTGPEPVGSQLASPRPVHLPARYDARDQIEAAVAAIRAHLVGNSA